MKYILANTVSILCIITAAGMIYLDKKGWGWLLFVAVICMTSMTSITSIKKE